MFNILTIRTMLANTCAKQILRKLLKIIHNTELNRRQITIVEIEKKKKTIKMQDSITMDLDIKSEIVSLLECFG